MKRICTLLLAAGLLFGAATGASAIDFNAKGQWLMGFSEGKGSPVDTFRGSNGVKTKGSNEDDFQAAQRLRLQLDAVASESLSGTVYFEIGTTQWGQARTGGALGADANNAIKLKRAYIDWAVPQSDAKVRMGIQGVALPNVAGGSAIMDTDVAGITVNYKFNDNVIKRVPMRRWGQPADFGGMAVYFASDASAFHTGDSVLIDGGYGIF